MGKPLTQARKLVRRWKYMAAGMTARALCGIVSGTARGQDAGKPVRVKAMAKEANPDWEVATVKSSNPKDTQGPHIRMPGRHVLLLDTTVEQFLLLGYGVQQSQLASVPGWVKTTRWDGDGVPDGEGERGWGTPRGRVHKF